MKRDAIVHQTANHYVIDVGKRGFEVYRNEVTAAVRVACVGHGPRYGLPWAIAECERREAGAEANVSRVKKEEKE